MISIRSTIPLLLCTLALSFAAVAFIINGALRTPTVEDIAASCKEQFDATRIAPICPQTEEKQNLVTVSPTTTNPGFSYPLGWNAIVATDTAEATTTIILGAPGLFTSCAICTKNALATMTTKPFVLTADQTLDAYVQSLYTAISDSVIKKETLENGIKYIVTGISLQDPAGSFTHVLFFGTTTQTVVAVPASPLSLVTTDEQQAFLSSLDFSLIE